MSGSTKEFGLATIDEDFGPDVVSKHSTYEAAVRAMQRERKNDMEVLGRCDRYWIVNRDGKPIVSRINDFGFDGPPNVEGW